MNLLKRKSVLASLFLALILSIIAILCLGTSKVFAVAGVEENPNNKFIVIDYQGKKVNATYEFTSAIAFNLK